MKKQILLFGLAAVIAGTSFSGVLASDGNLKDAIKMYKAGNYSGCIQELELVTKEDPSNAAAHYYMAIAYAQAGRVDDAINHYEKVINLNSQETLVRYAKRGKLCLEDAEKCQSTATLDEFIRARRGYDITNSVKNKVETNDLDELRRDINDDEVIEPARLKKFKNFSSSNNTTPSNDEIVAALRTLQDAGLSYSAMTPAYSDISNMFSTNANNNAGAMDNLMQLMGRMGGSTTSNQSIDPKILQTMMTSQMMGF